jgi:hypothetical protein
VVSCGDSQSGNKVVHHGPNGRGGVPLGSESTVDSQSRGDSQSEERNPSERGRSLRIMQTRRGREENILNVLVQVLQGNGRQPLLSLEHVSNIVLRDVQVRRDIRRLELLDSELGLALLRLGNGDRVGRGRTVEGGEGSVGHLE